MWFLNYFKIPVHQKIIKKYCIKTCQKNPLKSVQNLESRQLISHPKLLQTSTATLFWLPDLNLQHLHGEVVSSSCTKKWFNELELSTNLWKKWVLENTPSILGLFWTFGGLQFHDTSVDSPWWTCFHSTNHHWGGIVTVLSPTKSLYPYHEVYIFQITVYILIQLDQFNASFID